MPIVTGPGNMQGVEIPDMVGGYARMQQLRQMQQEAPLRQQALQQQVQIGQQNVQQGQLEIQQKQRAFKDQQAMDAAMQQWAQPKAAAIPAQGTQPAPDAQAATGAPATQGTPAPFSAQPDYDELATLAQKNGASYDTVSKLRQHALDLRDKASQIAKDDAATGASKANTLKTNNGMITDALTGVMNLPDDQLAQGLQYTTQQLAQNGLFDPQHVQLQQQLIASGDPAAIRKGLTGQIYGMGAFGKAMDDAQKKLDVDKKRGETDPNSPYYAPSSASVALGTAPGAAAIQANEVSQAGRKSAAEAAAKQPYELALAKQRQALSQGDPEAAGRLLVSGEAVLSELKARGATPDFIQKSLDAANRQSGGRYNAPKAEADFKIAGSPTNQAFFGSANSLTDKGGTLDQLAEAGKDIPQNQIPAFNKFADWQKAALGSGPLAKYASVVVGVADDYSKVMGGGSGSDTSRNQAIELIKPSASPAARAGAIDGIRGAVGSQTRSRIGNNPIMRMMYSAEGSTGNSGEASSGGKIIVTDPSGKQHPFDTQAQADHFKQLAGIK